MNGRSLDEMSVRHVDEVRDLSFPYPSEVDMEFLPEWDLDRFRHQAVV